MISPIYKSNLVSKFLIFKLLLAFSFCLALGSVELKAQTLTCPDDYVINLPEEECNVFIYYDSLVWSADFPATDPVFFPFPGTYLPTGITTITLAVSDQNNNFYTCDFEVNILAFNSTNFTCPGIVSVSLNGECERDLTATDILDGSFNPCDVDYTTEIFESNTWVPGVINADDVGSTFNVLLTNEETGHSCETLITVEGGEAPAITCPPNLVQFCNEPTDTAFTGVPELMGCYTSVNLSYVDDLTFTQCPDTFAFQITRTWLAISPNGTQTACEQLITGKRFPSSLVVFPQDWDGVNTPAISCNDTLNLTATAHPDITGRPLVGDFPPDASIHCKFAVSYNDNITHLCGDSYLIKRAWSVVQLCGPLTLRDTQTILVADVNPPFFEIPDTLFFSNSGGCIDSIFLPLANVLAECSGYGILVESPWGNFTSDGKWIHPDTIAGDYDVHYTLTDACGNDTTQTLVVKITDETLVSCPPTDTVNCDYYLSVLSPGIQSGNYNVFESNGMPTFYNNCSFVISQNATAVVDDCGNGVVTRNIFATNTTDTLSCTQSIIVQHISNFVAHFPADTAICVSPLQANLPDPTITMVNCEVLSPSFTDVIIPSGLAGCYTIEREWVILNSCAYTGDSTGADIELAPNVFEDNGDGIMIHTQTIHVNNNAALTFSVGCEIPDLYLDDTDCTYEINVPTPQVEGCGANINLMVSGSLGTVLGAPVSITPGIYSVTYTATDACAKSATCSTSFTVIDTIMPVAICKSVDTLDLPAPSGELNVWVTSLNNGSHDNCTDQLDFSYSQDSISQIRTFTCDDLGTHLIDVWIYDAAGNQSHCQTNLTIQPGLACQQGGNPLLGGTIETEQGAGVNNVKVTVASSSGYNQSFVTGANGQYLFQDVPLGDDVTITPEKDTLPLNGVSTFDLVTIRKHILGVDTLDSPYKIIAADINRSGAVSTFDIVEIRKLILVINTEFPNNTSWRFVDAAYVFPNPLNPFVEPFPESISVNNFSMDELDHHFIAIKIGDVNNSAITSLFTGGEGEMKLKSD
ncbi:MAG: hypothetical protein GC192_01630 [Bacteroidetes bacterium]|nr:hypothetical protein [Bacteroidota bacterium]